MQKFSAGMKTYKGSCHCGAVTYEFDYDAAAGTGRCNCSICSKGAWWGAMVKPDAFRLLSGEANLVAYPKAYSNYEFCKTCGIRAFNRGDLPGHFGPFVSVNLSTLDDVDLSGVKVTYTDGRHDTWAVLNTLPHADPFTPQQAT